jgi:hypothetical protein
MFKGILVAGLVLLGAALLDQYLTHGWYTDAAMSMLRQINQALVSRLRRQKPRERYTAWPL